MSMLNEVLGKYQGKWALLSIKTGKPLAYAPGTEKPSEEWVAKQEKRVQYFKHLNEQYGMYGTGGTGALAEDEPTKKKRKKLKRFSEDSTPSQIHGQMDAEQGIQVGPLGEDEPKKKKKKKVKEDLDGTGGTEAAGFQAMGGSETKTKTKTVDTIKKVMKSKYRRKLL